MWHFGRYGFRCVKSLRLTNRRLRALQQRRPGWVRALNEPAPPAPGYQPAGNGGGEGGDAAARCESAWRNLPPPQNEAAEALGVSRDSVIQARKAIAKAVPEVVAAVDAGGLPVRPVRKFTYLNTISKMGSRRVNYLGPPEERGRGVWVRFWGQARDSYLGDFGEVGRRRGSDIRIPYPKPTGP